MHRGRLTNIGKYLPQLDGLRALAILLVLVAHGAGRLADTRLPIGWVGVNVFFVLSGFLITRLLAKEKDVNGSLDYKAFVVRRGLRIWPLYFLAFLLFALILPNIPSQYFDNVYVSVDKPRFQDYFQSLWSYPLSLQNYNVPLSDVRLGLGVYWSLAVEEHFYIVWPLAFAMFRARYLLIGLFCVGTISALMRFGVLDPLVSSELVSHATHTNLLSIAAGSALGIFLARRKPPRWLTSNLAVTVGVVLLAYAVLYPFAPAPYRSRELAYFAVIAGSCALIPSAALGRLRALGWRPLARIGKVSFGMYLLHALVLGYISGSLLAGRGNLKSGASGVALVLVFIGCTWLVAEVSYRWFESPFLRMKRRFSRISGTQTNVPVRADPQRGIDSAAARGPLVPLGAPPASPATMLPGAQSVGPVYSVRYETGDASETTETVPRAASGITVAPNGPTRAS